MMSVPIWRCMNPKLKLIGASLLTALVLAFLLSRVFSGFQWESEPELEGLIPVTLDRVIDGDTIKVFLPGGKRANVHFLGIDTPEMNYGKDEPPEPLAEEATRFTEEMLARKRITIETDVEKRDRYERILAYVWVDIGGVPVMVNEALLMEGLADIRIYEPNVKYYDRLAAALDEAREAGRGLWSAE